MNYRFVLCFENDIYPGYVTEKPFEAYLAGTVPLYYGYDVMKYLNPKAVLNFLEYKYFESWICYIKELENDTKLYKKIYEQPILLKKPNLDDVLDLIRRVLEVKN
jgi:hypothetical protein